MKKNNKSKPTGNKCGHNKSRLRGADVARRGKGGQPPAIGRVSAALKCAMTSSWRLASWWRMKGRRPRSERREIDVVVLQVLISKYMKLETLECARIDGRYLVAPDYDQLAKHILKAPDWAAVGIKPDLDRIGRALKRFEKLGYITRTAVLNRPLANGAWSGAPRVIRFTKKFFFELAGGNRKLWDAVTARKRKAIAIKEVEPQNPFELNNSLPLIIVNHRQMLAHRAGDLVFLGHSPPIAIAA